MSETAGLGIAQKHIDWWLKNDVYPIYFTWESGLIGSLRALLADAAGRIGFSRFWTRDVADYTGDPFIERAGRALGVEKIWSSMKRSAERASQEPDGGAALVAKHLNDFIGKHAADRIELHAVGHSAGAIFHAHFLAEIASSFPNLKFGTLQMLAPAISVAAFKNLVIPVCPGSVAEVVVFTMSDNLEREDNVVELYRKSLLYFVSHSCEPSVGEPILGLEKSLREDYDLVDFFELNRFVPRAHKSCVIFSKTVSVDGREASQATTHGGFDDDSSSMNSVLRRVLNKPDNEKLNLPYEEQHGARSTRSDALVDWPEELLYLGTLHNRTVQSFGSGESRLPSTGSSAMPLGAQTFRAGGRKVALCVGINDYSFNKLRYCVADSQRWARALADRGFDIRDEDRLTDGNATREAILYRLQSLLRGSKAGDVVVFQYSGHGAISPSKNDENVLLPIDWHDGNLIFDLEIRRIIDEAPKGVNVTTFFDSCHAETNTRAVGQQLLAAAFLSAQAITERDLKAARSQSLNTSKSVLPELLLTNDPQSTFRTDMGSKFIDLEDCARDRPAVKAAVAAQVAKLDTTGAGQAARGSYAGMRNVSFAASKDDQVAFEFEGWGRFTLHALKVMSEIGSARLNKQRILRFSL